MTERQNITLAIPKETLNKAKHLAIAKDQSLSGLLTEFIEDLVRQDERYKQAQRQQLALMVKDYSISFWDAMIVSCAQQMGCKVLWTEGLNSGQYTGDLVIQNP